MFDDNFREDAAFKDETPASPAEIDAAPSLRSGRRFLGMTSIQRFIIAVLMMVMVCALGMGCLLVTGKIGLPF